MRRERVGSEAVSPRIRRPFGRFGERFGEKFGESFLERNLAKALLPSATQGAREKTSEKDVRADASAPFPTVLWEKPGKGLGDRLGDRRMLPT